MNAIKGEQWLFSREKRLQDEQRAHELMQVSGPVIQMMAQSALREFGMFPFYIEERRGRGGEPFSCAKSRTIPQVDMSPHAVPILFQLMRASGLDEMVQAIHVKDGDMLLTGRPRPLVDEGSESTHHSVGMMRRYVPRRLFASWLRVYDMGPPGLLSSFGNVSKTLPKDDELLCITRAEMDIKDVELASPEHDIKIIMGAMAHLEALREFLTQATANPLLFPDQE